MPSIAESPDCRFGTTVWLRHISGELADALCCAVANRYLLNSTDDKPIYNYVAHPNGTTTTTGPDRLLPVVRVLQILIAIRCMHVWNRRLLEGCPGYSAT